MAKLAIVTPTYRPDFEYFRDLHASVLRHTPDDIVHHAIVPKQDLQIFSEINSKRLKLHRTSDVLPPGFLSTYSIATALAGVPKLSVLAKIHAINARRPWLPVRGWILQQIIKLAFVGSLQEDVALIADSDVVLIRELNASSFLQNGSVRFYRLPDGVHSGMANHLLWHDCARRLLGLSSIASSTLPDYVSAFVAWSPAIVRRIQGQIAKISGIDWASSIAQQLHFSECVLYGAYVDNLGAASDRAVIGADTLCRSYWSDEPLTELEAENFVASVERRDLAILLQSKSHTPLPLRRRIVEMVAQRAE